MIITPEELQAIQKIIQDYHTAFIANAISPEIVAPQILAKLKAQGLIKPKVSSIEDAYLYGQLLAMLENPQIAKMNYTQFQAYVKAHPVPLTPIEKQAMKIAMFHAGQYCQGLGNKVAAQTGEVLIEADSVLRQKMLGEIQTATAQNIQRRESISQLKSDLGWKTKDWTRDLARIAITEKQSAMLQGQADHYVKKHGGDSYVAKRPMPDACPRCKKLYIGPDDHPRIFQLSALSANGTNFGKKQADWLPTIGPVHPNCQCVMIRVPNGWGFDSEGRLVPGGTYGQKYDSETDMEMAMRAEADLQKAYQFDREISFQGIPVVIENPIGTLRKWKSADGGLGETFMLNAYGFIAGTEGADADGIDVFLGPDPNAQMAYVIHQQNPETGTYDEDKCMLGFSNQEQAELCYRVHYDHPDEYLLSVTPMELEQFKRWIAVTRPCPDLQKSAKAEMRFIVPLEKGLAPEQGSFTSPAGNRAPGAGTSANYAVGFPKKVKRIDTVKRQDYFPELSDFNETEADRDNWAVRRKPEDYEIEEPVKRRVHEVNPPDWDTGAAREGKEARKKNLVQRFVIPNLGRPKNTVEIQKSQQVIATGPKGGKIIGYTPKLEPIYLDSSDADKARMGHLSRHVHAHGGKATEHTTQKDAIMLKVPHAKKSVLEALKKEYGVQAEVKPGGNYELLAVTHAEYHKIEAALTAKHGPIPEIAVKTVKKPEEPEEKKEKAPPFAPTDLPRKSQLEKADKSKLQQPPKASPYFQRGSKVSCKFVDGSVGDAEVLGQDCRGDYVVQKAGARHTVSKAHVKPVSGGTPSTGASYADVAPENILQPTERHKKLMQRILDLKCVGNHKATEYINWLWDHGHEVYCVGGLVRDMIEGTMPDSEMSDEAILEKMKDVDLVTTADPTTIMEMFDKVNPEFKKGDLDQRCIRDGLRWGVIQNIGAGIGLDVASMADEGTNAFPVTNTEASKIHKTLLNDEPPAVFDHRMKRDCLRRDSGCNTLYYDPKNEVIFDPQGHGISDAEHKVARATVPASERTEFHADNQPLGARFIKLVTKGYTLTNDTWHLVKDHFSMMRKKFKHVPSTFDHMVYVAFGKKGKTAEQALATFKEGMGQAGMLFLYDQMFGGREGETLVYLKSHIAKAEKKAATLRSNLKAVGIKPGEE